MSGQSVPRPRSQSALVLASEPVLSQDIANTLCGAGLVFGHFGLNHMFLGFLRLRRGMRAGDIARPDAPAEPVIGKPLSVANTPAAIRIPPRRAPFAALETRDVAASWSMLTT